MNPLQDDVDNSILRNNSNNNLGGLFPLNSNDFSFLNQQVLNNNLIYNIPSLIEKTNQSPNLRGNNLFTNINKDAGSKFSPVENSLIINSDKTGIGNNTIKEESNKQLDNLFKSEDNEIKNAGKKRFMKAYEKVSDKK